MLQMAKPLEWGIQSLTELTSIYKSQETKKQSHSMGCLPFCISLLLLSRTLPMSSFFLLGKGYLLCAIVH